MSVENVLKLIIVFIAAILIALVILCAWVAMKGVDRLSIGGDVKAGQNIYFAEKQK